MDYLLLEARAHKKGFVAAAGEDYRDANSEIVRSLKSAGKPALLGIQKNDGIYTILGDNACHLLTNSGELIDIEYENFLKKLKAFAMRKGKKADFEFMPIDETRSVWLKNAQTMTTMWALMKFIILPRN